MDRAWTHGRIAIGLAVVATSLLPTSSSVADSPEKVDLQIERLLDPTNQSVANFGDSVKSAGDINADGFDDLIIGVSGFFGQAFNEGRAYIYLGSASGSQSNPVTLDPTDQQNAYFGRSVASAGDINGDGFDDVIVGANEWDGEQPDEGRAYIYLGSASGLQSNPVTLDPTDQSAALFGSSVASAGDINADGFDDVIIGANGWNGQQTDEGRAYIYLGSASGLQSNPVTLDPTDQGNALFGNSVASAGDINGDDFDDVVVGAHLWSGQQTVEGRAYIYLGSASGLQSNPVTLDPTDQGNAVFGNSVASAGDINGDDFDDVIVGAQSWDGQQADEGRAYMYLGSANGLQANPATLDPADQVGANFGHSVASAGDINADGFDDVIVGASVWDGQQVNEGRAYIYRGSASGLQSAPATLDPTNQAGARFGRSVASAGDINADGFDDVIVGAHFWNGEQTDEGRVYIYGHIHVPVLGSIGDKAVAEGETLSFKVRASDPNGEALTYSATGLPSGASFDPGTREFTWTPSFDQAGTYEGITFRVHDGLHSDSETIAISVRNVNRAPALDPVGNRTVAEGGFLSFNISGSDPDGDDLTFSAPLLPPDAMFDPTNVNEFSWTPDYDDAGSYLVRFKVSDGSASDTQEIYIKVTQAPKPVPTLTLNVTKPGRKVTGSGLLNPAHEGRDIAVTLSRKVSGVFRKISTLRDTQDEIGFYSVTFPRPSAGSCKLRAFFTGDEDHGAVGTTKTFRC